MSEPTNTVNAAATRMMRWATLHPEVDTQGLDDYEWRCLACAALDLEMKTPEEWDRELYPDSRIYDPDGWRVAGAPRWDDPISREEFEQRRAYCTIGRRLP